MNAPALALVLFATLFADALAISCYQCRGADTDCEKARNIEPISCNSLTYGENGLAANFKPFSLPTPNVNKGSTYLCVHFAYDIYTYRGCMMSNKAELEAKCKAIKTDLSLVKERYTCNVCTLDGCNSATAMQTSAVLLVCSLLIRALLR